MLGKTGRSLRGECIAIVEPEKYVAFVQDGFQIHSLLNSKLFFRESFLILSLNSAQSSI